MAKEKTAQNGQAKDLEKSFVTYKQLSLVNHAVNQKTNQEKFVTLPYTGTGVVGKRTAQLEIPDEFPNIIVREEVFRRLKKVDEQLKVINPNWQLVVVYGYRTPVTQQQEYDKQSEQLRAAYLSCGKEAEVDGEAFIEQVHRKVAVPSVAGHPTGGAVNVYIYDFVQEKALDFGTEVCDFSTEDCFYAAPKFDGTPVAENRALLRQVMRAQDFAPYDAEWWHFSYGDKEWVVYSRSVGKPVPTHLYNAVDEDEIVYADKNKYVETFDTEQHLVLAVQKSGRLTDETIAILKKSGIDVSVDDRKLFVKSASFPLEILLVRDDDIPQLVASGIADIGIVGENVFFEKKLEAEASDEVFGASINKYLGFGKCSLWIAVPEKSPVKNIGQLAGKSIATSYPLTAKKFLKESDVAGVTIRKFFGSVEITPSIGFADAIIDIVSTGNSLRQNKLRELQKIFDSEAVLIQKLALDETKQKLLDEFLLRFQSGVDAKKYAALTVSVLARYVENVQELFKSVSAKQVLAGTGGQIVTVQAVIPKSKVWDVIMGVKALVGSDYKACSFSDISGIVMD